MNTKMILPPNLIAEAPAQAQLSNVGTWIVVYCPRKRSLLFAKRAKLTNNPYFWNLLGGRVDPGESPRAAAVRELREEAGIEITERDLVKLCQTRKRCGEWDEKRKTMIFYLLMTDRLLRPRLNEEHSEAIWFDQDNLPLSITAVTLAALKSGVVQQSIHYAKAHPKEVVEFKGRFSSRRLQAKPSEPAKQVEDPHPLR